MKGETKREGGGSMSLNKEEFKTLKELIQACDRLQLESFLSYVNDEVNQPLSFHKVHRYIQSLNEKGLHDLVYGILCCPENKQFIIKCIEEFNRQYPYNQYDGGE